MKNLYLILFLFLPFWIFAQDFTSSLNQWKLESSGDFGWSSTYQVRFDGDTLINGTQYRILNRWDTQTNTWIPIESRYWRDGSDSEVYFLSHHPFNGYEEKLRYAFNVSKGDTLTVSDQEVVVNWISITKQFEDTVRVVHVRNLKDSTQINIWMQGGGGFFAPFYDEFAFVDASYSEHLQCYWRNDTVRFSSSWANCEEGLVSILSNTSAMTLSIWPNPATQQITFLLPQDWKRYSRCRYQLINMKGILIEERWMNPENEQVSLILPKDISGIHVVRLLSDDGHMANGLILIN